MLKKWRTLDSKIVFDTGWFKVRQETCETHSGRVIDDYFISTSRASGILSLKFQPGAFMPGKTLK
jgi:hypothetical protein